MPDSLSEETSQLLEDYLRHCRPGGSPRPPPGPKARTLRRVAADMQAQHRDFFRDSCVRLRGAEPAALLRSVAEQLEAEGGLNWGRVVALIAFAGELSGSGCAETPRRLAGALSHYLAQEQRAWLESSGGWDGFYHFFNKSNTHPDNQNSTTYNAIIAAAGFGLAGLAFLLAVR